MLNEFERNPPKLNILGKIGENFYIKETLVFVGDVSNDIYKALQNKSNTLKKHYGVDWQDKLGFGPKKILGGEDIDIDLDDIDLFDVGENITPVIKSEPVKKVKSSEVVTTKDEQVIPPTKVTFIRNVSLFPEDKVSEFKEKIYLAGGPPLYKQHLFFFLRNNTVPVWYQAIDENGVVSINILGDQTEKILDIPIDRNFYESRESLKVYAYDQFNTIGNIYTKYGINTYYLVNIDKFIASKKGQIEEFIKSDKYQLNLLYYSFILKFWPMMTIDVFRTYITSEKSMPDVYPDLMPKTGQLNTIYNAEKEVLDKKYELLKDAHAGYKKNPKFKKYNPEFVLKMGKISPTSKIAVSIKNATLVTHRVASLNVRTLFDLVHVTDDVPLIKAKLLRGRVPYELTKSHKKNIVKGENIQAIFEQIKYQIQLPYYNTMLFAVRARSKDGKIITAAQEVSKYIIFVLYDNGKCLVRSTWGEDERMDFQKIHEILQKSINPVIKQINKYGRLIFTGSERLSEISRLNSEFTELSLSIFWKHTISAGSFQNLIENINKLESSGIIFQQEGESHDYILKKGITGYDINQLDKYISVINYYSYLSDGTIKPKWNMLFDQGRNISVVHRTTDIKLEINGIKDNEFKYFYLFIIGFLYRMETSIKTSNTKVVSIPSLNPNAKINTLKLLKARDPEAFIFKKFGSDVVYSRICQKDHQPIPFSSEEIIMLPTNERERAVKFWNYTTESEMYYLCRQGKFPYLNFITGQHPKNYCLACCKKTPAYNVTIGDKSSIMNKKEKMYKTCLEMHEYVEEEEETGTSRYVMIYGKDLYIGRIGKLPDTIQQYLLYNLANVDILSEFSISRTFTMNKKKYSVDRLFKITKNIKVHKVPVIELVEHLRNKSWEYKRSGIADIAPIEVIENPKKNRRFQKHYTRILNADMNYPILVYNAKTFTVIVDGLHRLSRAYIEKHPTIKVRYVTDKQLAKVLISSHIIEAEESTIGVADDPPVSTVCKNTKVRKKRKTGGAIDEKKPGYYIYGVPQNSKHVSNVGMIYSLAVTLNMEFDQFISFTIKILRNNPQYFKLLLNGELVRYFENNKQFVDTICKVFKGSSMGSVFPDRWNELFIDIARVCYDKIVIIFDDTSIITTGTSMKASTEDINLVLPYHVTYLEDLIPDNETQMEYILILQRRKKSKSAFEKRAKVYYPIFIFVPYLFFKAQTIEKKVYTQHDEIMKLVKNMLKEILDEKRAGIITRDNIDFRTILEFLEKNKSYLITKLHLNSKDMCYAVICKHIKTNTHVYIPITYSYFSGSEKFYPEGKNSDDIIDYGAFNRKSSKFTAKELGKFIKDFNKFVLDKSKEAGIIGAEGDIIPIYPLIKPSHKIIYNKRIIGVISDDKHYYITDCKNIALCEKEFNSSLETYYMYYDPTEINNIVVEKTKKVFDKRHKLRAQAFYNKYLYRIFTLEFIRYFDKDRNDQIRKKIISLINKSNFRKEKNMDAFRDKLSLILEEFPQDISRIQEQVDVFYTRHFDKNMLIDSIKASVYEFDRTTLFKIMLEGKDYWTLTTSEQIVQHKKITDKLRSIAKNFIKIGEPKLKEYNENIITSCKDVKAPYCSGQKLIMSSQKFEEYTSLFASDLLNPMKRPYLVQLIYSENVINEFKFARNNNEDIYIKRDY